MENVGRIKSVDLKFAGMTGTLCRYSVCGGKAEMVMADYFEDAPEEVLEDYVRFVLDKGSGPPERFIAYVSSDSFVQSQRPRFLAKSRRFMLSSEGEHRSLSRSAERLEEAGLLASGEAEGVYLTWTRRPSVSVLGTCHSIFRVISISKALDTDSLPPDCLDFVMYHEFLHVRQGVRIGKRKHDSDFRRQEQAFPGYERIKKDLAGLKVRIPSLR